METAAIIMSFVTTFLLGVFVGGLCTWVALGHRDGEEDQN